MRCFIISFRSAAQKKIFNQITKCFNILGNLELHIDTIKRTTDPEFEAATKILRIVTTMRNTIEAGQRATKPIVGVLLVVVANHLKEWEEFRSRQTGLSEVEYNEKNQ